MSYNRKSRYPSVKTPGVYRDATDEQLGLDADNLQELSLGNWNSIYKGNKLFLSGDLLEKIKTSGGIETKFRTSLPKQGTRVLVWRYKRNDEQTSSENAILLAQGPIIEYLSEVEDITDHGNRDTEAVKKSRLIRTRAVYDQFYGATLPNPELSALDVPESDGSAVDTSGFNGGAGLYDRNGDTLSIRPQLNHSTSSITDKAISFDEGRAFIQEREGGGDIVLTLNDVARTKLEQHHAFEREITTTEINNWGDGGPEKGNDKDFTHELIVMVEFDIQAMNIDEQTLFELEGSSYQSMPLPNDGTPTGNLSSAYMNNYIRDNFSYITLRGLEKNLFDGPDGESTNHPFRALNPGWGPYPQGRDFFQDSPHDGGYGYYRTDGDFEANIGAVDWNPGYRTDIKLGEDFWPDKLKFSDEDTNDIGDLGLLPQKGDYEKQTLRENFENPSAQSTGTINPASIWDNTFDFIGYPDFKLDIAIDNENYVQTLDTYDTPIDFVVNVKTSNDNDLLYYDREENPIEYRDASYPIKVNLDVNLYYDYGFENEREPLNEQEVISAFAAGTDESSVDYLTNNIRIPYYASNPEKCYYKYQVIQWGDEKTLLTDEQIESSYFFNFYDSEDYPKTTDYFYKKYQQSQAVEAIPIRREGARVQGNYASVPNITTHPYNTPGVKTIKIVVYRYTPDAAFILQTYLVTRNIVVGDGVLKSQDFSIFGGGDFNYIPITENQVVIGGLDDNSDYNNSVEKIVKDDLFLKQDYLDRTSARDYIDKYNNGLLGETPSQLNLGQMRMFNKPKDIYDFIGGNKLEWINQNSGSLPLNSLATDIFINNKDCIVDLNPSNSDYSVLNNQVGLSGIGILVGDYELSQEEGSSVTKQSSMKIAELDNTNDRQAF